MLPWPGTILMLRYGAGQKQLKKLMSLHPPSFWFKGPKAAEAPWRQLATYRPQEAFDQERKEETRHSR
eukprot:12881959-Prorocentrum_lima.AAC.1